MNIDSPAKEMISKPTHSDLANRWISNYRSETIAYGLGCFRYYHDKLGIWKGMEQEYVDKEILQVMEQAQEEGFRPTNGSLTSIRKLAKTKLYRSADQWDSNPYILVCKNLTLNLLNGPEPHSLNHYATKSLPYDFDPECEPTYFLHVLSVLPKEVRDFFQEYLGYCLTKDTHHEIAVWLHGPSGCGKSTIIEGIRAMAGPHACTLGLSDIENWKFRTSMLIGKNLALATEQPAISMIALDLTNSIISGEKIIVEKKYEHPFEYTPHAKIIWAMTELPEIPSSQNGIFRRIIIIEMPPIPESKRDPAFKQMIKNEGPGILNWAIEGLQRLYELGNFVIPQTLRNSAAEFKENNDIPMQFVSECCELDEGCKVQAQPLYEQYTRWCKNNGHEPKTGYKMADEWKRLGFKQVKSKGRRYWKGLRIMNSGDLARQDYMGIEEQRNKENNILINKVSTLSTLTTLSSIPLEWNETLSDTQGKGN